MTLQVQFSTIVYMILGGIYINNRESYKQSWRIEHMILGGIYLGMALETFRRLSPAWKHNKVLTYCLEISFWLMQTIILFYILYLANKGEMRFYVFIAGLLGFSIYQAIVATFYRKVLEFTIGLSLKLLFFCKKTIQILMIIPIMWLINLFLSIINFILLLVFKIVKIILIPVQWLSKLIYSLLPKKIKQLINKTPQFYSIIKYTCIKWTKYT